MRRSRSSTNNIQLNYNYNTIYLQVRSKTSSLGEVQQEVQKLDKLNTLLQDR